MPHQSGTLEDRFDLGPCILAAIPIGAIGGLSIVAPMAWTGLRIAATIGLLLLATALLTVGWPSRVSSSSRLVDATRVVSPRTRLRLRILKDREMFPTAARFAIERLGDTGSAELLATAASPAPMLELAMNWCRCVNCTVEVDWLVLGASMPEHFEFASSVPKRGVRLPGGFWRGSGLAPWLGVVGCVFVIGVLGSVLHAHLQRGGAVTLGASVLGASLCVMAIFLLHLGLATRFHVEGADNSLAGGRLSQLGILGPRVRMDWGAEARAIWFIWSEMRGDWHLVVDHGNRIESVRFQASGPHV